MAVWDCPSCLKHCDSPGELVQHLHDDHLYEESGLPSESKGHRIRSTDAETSESDSEIQYVCPFPNCTHTRQYTSKYNLLWHYFDHSAYTKEERPRCPNCHKRHKTLGSLTRHWEKSCRKKFEGHGYTKAEGQRSLRELNMEKKRIAKNMDRGLRQTRTSTRHAHTFGNNEKREGWRPKPRENQKNNEASIDVRLALDPTQGETNDHVSTYDLASANHGGVAAHDMRVMRSACLSSSLRARTDQYTEHELPSIDISGPHSLSPQRLNESSVADYGESFVLNPPSEAEIGTDGYDRTFAAARHFSHLRSSQRFAADHISDHHKLGGCKPGRHNGLVAPLTEEVDEVAKGAGQQDGSGSVRADSGADSQADNQHR